ncbi:phospholipase A1 [Folsomia candida]|uniref:phospholipase A1 n=1 Tax=Folsomia candida TaxID=158441 RepID=UPI000B8FF4D9|nr:phospholipase A1 [Folsomia candida]
MSSKLFLLVLSLCVGAISSAGILNAGISSDVNDVKFYVYPSSTDRKEVILDNVQSLDAIKSGVGVTLCIDGFLSNAESPMSQLTKNSVLSKLSTPQNIIVVDWGRLSGNGNTFANLIETGAAYSKVLANVGPVGSRIADVINFIVTTKNILPSQINIIGHSLGAHIAGACGTFYRDRYGALLSRISGLDPAGPFFNLQIDVNKRLHSGDAAFVDIYNTNRGTLGDSSHQTGDINVYVNGGDNQPGCAEADTSGFAGYCSHSYSWKFFDMTFHRNVEACPCVGLPCQCKSSCNTQCDSPIIVGAGTSPSARGAYHLIITDSLSQYPASVLQV